LAGEADKFPGSETRRAFRDPTVRQSDQVLSKEATLFLTPDLKLPEI